METHVRKYQVYRVRYSPLYDKIFLALEDGFGGKDKLQVLILKSHKKGDEVFIDTIYYNDRLNYIEPYPVTDNIKEKAKTMAKIMLI
jgi:hypothetical protein